MEIDYSLIICTYNPDERLLERCLHAVHQLNLENISSEVIIVDNNSTIPVSGLPCILQYLKNKQHEHPACCPARSWACPGRGH